MSVSQVLTWFWVTPIVSYYHMHRLVFDHSLYMGAVHINNIPKVASAHQYTPYIHYRPTSRIDISHSVVLFLTL
jgi:hypothetical protein